MLNVQNQPAQHNNANEVSLNERRCIHRTSSTFAMRVVLALNLIIASNIILDSDRDEVDTKGWTAMHYA